jgi:hypothetical protein
MKKTKLTVAGALLLATLVASQASAALVWQSTFDSSADGVIDLYNNNAGKVMIGPAAGGNLQIEAWDNSTNAYTPDKAGRPLGSTLTYNSTFSAQYIFSWSALPTAAPDQEAYELVGFLGAASPQTRQVFGTVLRHWNDSGNYKVALDTAAMGVGFTDFGYKKGPTVSLGASPFGQKFDLRLEFDGAQHVLSISLRDAGGAVLGSQVADLDTDLAGWHAYGATPFNNEINSIALTRLGWSDYTGWAGDKASIWQVDSLAYYDTAQVPVVPEPASIVLAMMSLVAMVGLRRTR